MIKICEICGKEFEPVKFGEGRKYCYECSPMTKDKANPKTYMRRAIKKELVKYKGGKCEICGYDKCIAALQFHHLDAKQKDFELGNVYNYKHSMDEMKQEVDKCILVCANCHAELHFIEDNK